MALIDKASLLMVPSVYEDGTLYNVLPSGNKAPDETGNHNGYDQTRADFTFSRGFNLSATRIGASGLIEKGRENLLLQSNSFSTSPWSNNDASVTSGQTDKDGGTNAWKWKVNSNSAYHYSVQSHTTTNSVCAYSIYAKANGYNFFRLEQGNNGQGAWFNLTTGTIGTTSSNTIAKINDEGNGWYRCEISLVTAATTNFLFGFSASETLNFTGDNVSGGFVMYSQFEKGLVATDYIETGATTATAGVLENTPRIDYSSGAGALLLEPQRTNVLPHSEYFGAYNLGAGVTINQNYSLSPEGLQNATRLNLTTSANIGVEKPVSGFFESQTHTISVWARCTSGTETFRLKCTHASVLDYFSNDLTATTEWQRFDFSKTFTSTSGTGIVAGVVNGTDAQARSIEIYGLQLETNSSYPSSYVPTYGSAATRGADNSYTGTTSGIIGQTQGVVFCEFIYRAFAEDMRLGISDGTSANYNNIRITSGGTLYVLGAASSVLQYEINAGALTDGQTYKVALKYNTNDIEVFVNGVSKGTDTSATIGACNRFGFDNRSAGANPFYSDVKEAILFDTALTDAECVTLTTL